MTTKLICIAGGSGSGKSTLADNLVGRLGADAATVLHLDDYQREKERVPLTASMRRNYDHPTAVDFERFNADLAMLKSGRDITVTRRLKWSSMEMGVAANDTFTIFAKPIVIVEGYLALHDGTSRALYDASIFLRATAETRIARRRWVKDAQYVNEVLLPMHGYFIEPTAQFADLIIDIDTLAESEVLDIASVFIDQALKTHGP